MWFVVITAAACIWSKYFLE